MQKLLLDLEIHIIIVKNLIILIFFKVNNCLQNTFIMIIEQKLFILQLEGLLLILLLDLMKQKITNLIKFMMNSNLPI